MTFLAIYYCIGLLINKENETDLFSISLVIYVLYFYSKRGGVEIHPIHHLCIRPWTTSEVKIVSNGNVLAGTFGTVNLKSNILKRAKIFEGETKSLVFTQIDAFIL